MRARYTNFASALPARGASIDQEEIEDIIAFASALPARGASVSPLAGMAMEDTLPRRYLHGVHLLWALCWEYRWSFASALPARGASAKADKLRHTIL